MLHIKNLPKNQDVKLTETEFANNAAEYAKYTYMHTA